MAPDDTAWANCRSQPCALFRSLNRVGIATARNDRSLSELPDEKKSNFGANSHRRAVLIGPFELARSRGGRGTYGICLGVWYFRRVVSVGAIVADVWRIVRTEAFEAPGPRRASLELAALITRHVGRTHRSCSRRSVQGFDNSGIRDLGGIDVRAPPESVESDVGGGEPLNDDHRTRAFRADWCRRCLGEPRRYRWQWRFGQEMTTEKNRLGAVAVSE